MVVLVIRSSNSLGGKEGDYQIRDKLETPCLLAITINSQWLFS